MIVISAATSMLQDKTVMLGAGVTRKFMVHLPSLGNSERDLSVYFSRHYYRGIQLDLPRPEEASPRYSAVDNALRSSRIPSLSSPFSSFTLISYVFFNPLQVRRLEGVPKSLRITPPHLLPGTSQLRGFPVSSLSAFHLYHHPHLHPPSSPVVLAILQPRRSRLSHSVIICPYVISDECPIFQR